MLDTTPIHLQRARGRAAVEFARVGGRTALRGLHQSGCAKAFLPRIHGPVPEVVFLNTAGGLTGGDRFGLSARLGADTSAVLTTQTAERAYRSAGGAADVRVSLAAGPGARLAWLPQETILFDGASLHRTTELSLAADAEAVLAETVVLGRAAMGETVTRVALRDTRRVERDGIPVYLDPFAIDTVDLSRPGAAGLGGARNFATLAYLARGAEDALGPLRAVLAEEGVEAAASAWDGRLVLRARAFEAFPLRRMLARAITTLRRAPLPRVWQT